MKILANDGLAPEGIQALQEAGFEVITNKVEQGDLINFINNEGVEMILVRSATKVRQELIDACEGLKLIGRGGVGMDNIDVDYARSKGIKVINTPGASSQSVAELVIAHLFGICRFLQDSNRQMPINGSSNFGSLKKSYAKGLELRGKTIGLIGFGRIGQSVAQYALGLGMKVLAYDAISMTKEIYLEFAEDAPVKITISTVDMETILSQSDFISVHTPAQADGKAVIGKEEIARMKDGVMLINASRGGIIDENDLVEALDSGKVAAAAIDVFINEPTPNADFLKHSKISFTPHTGAATKEAQARVGTELASQIIETFALA
jgi:D-3-phosphoglycerate dehydrogenase